MTFILQLLTYFREHILSNNPNEHLLWNESADLWINESREILFRIASMSDARMRHDLYLMHSNVDNSQRDVLREYVKCKFSNHQSDKHKKLVKKFEDCKQNLLEHLTYGLLAS